MIEVIKNIKEVEDKVEIKDLHNVIGGNRIILAEKSKTHQALKLWLPPSQSLSHSCFFIPLLKQNRFYRL